MTKTTEKTFTKKDLEKEWDDGVEYGREQGRLDVFEDLLKIKYATWSVHSVNNKEWSLGNKKLDHPLDLNVDKPLKIIITIIGMNMMSQQKNLNLLMKIFMVVRKTTL